MTTPAPRQLALVGGNVVRPDLDVSPLDVLIEHGKISALVDPTNRAALPTTVERIDVSGHVIAPGFIDVQINGGWGHDFTTDASSILPVAARLPETGVTSFLPTVVTAQPSARRAAIEAMTAIAREGYPVGAADPIGLHFEGPIISPARVGAHTPDLIGMPTSEITTWTRGNGVALVTLAPEIDGAIDTIDALVAQGVVVAVGHTECSAGQFALARAHGATMVTHLFNAMAPFSHRAPGPIGAVLADDSVNAGLICDGIHVDPVAIAMAWRTLGPHRTVLVTDAVAALGIRETTANLGDLDVTIGPDGVRISAGVLAGSNLSLDQAVRNLVEYTGCTAAEAISTVTANPARLLSLADRGTIEPGRRADLVVLDDDLHVRRTIIEGHLAWKS